MSIFPKRTLPGTNVTIHWNFNTSSLKEKHIFPFVRIGVKDPNGNVCILFEKNVLALPENNSDTVVNNSETGYLNKNLPVFIVAEYLSGKNSKEKLVEILQNIKNGRHYYFTYQIPENAPLGKYSLISEVYNEGNIKYSTTASDDFFYVENLSLVSLDSSEGIYQATINNPSLETIPVKVVELDEQKKTILRASFYELPPLQNTVLRFDSEKTLLLYNEEREVISLFPDQTPLILKNHQYLTLAKQEEGQERIFIMERCSDSAYYPEGLAKEIWQNADGLSTKAGLVPQGCENIYNEMLEAGLIQELKFSDIKTFNAVS